jgi:hypothetical protein
MNWRVLSAVIAVFSSMALASRLASGDDKKFHPPHEVCFNVFCTYERQNVLDAQGGQGPHDGQFEKCHAASTFQKFVSDEGEEINDESADRDDNPKFEVECDGKTVYNNSAHRYTDWQGTRIQALAGPYPAVVLGRGALRDTHQYEISALELWDQTLHGYCYIYTGTQ